MKLTALLEKNQSVISEFGLGQNLGDHYLCTHNKIFANIRRAVLRHGFSFSDAQNRFYEALPLSQLDWILEKKTIPFCDNVGVLQDVDLKAKNQISWDDICDQLKRNYLFHESCHGVARSILGKQKIDLLGAQIEDSVHRHLLRVFIEESFANTCELISIVDARDASHRIFFEWNSYVCMFNERSNLIQAISTFGESQVFKFVMLCYLHFHFQNDRLEDSQFQRILNFSKYDFNVKPQAIKQMRSIAKIAFQLNPRFRETTTSFYLKKSGIAAPIEKLLEFDFMKVLENSGEWHQSIDQIAAEAIPNVL